MHNVLCFNALKLFYVV